MIENKELEMYLQHLKEAGALVVKNVRLHKCILLSEQKQFYCKNWCGIICGIAHIEKLADVNLNASSENYEIWGLARQNGVFEKFLLLTLDQGVALQKAFDFSDNLTIDLPPYEQHIENDLGVVWSSCGGKLAPVMGATHTQYDDLLKNVYFFGK